MQVYCDRGWIDLDISRDSCTIYDADRPVEELPPVTPEQSYRASAPADNLVEVIVRGAPNLSPPEIGWRTVELLDAAYRSAGNAGRQGGGQLSVRVCFAVTSPGPKAWCY